MSFELRIFFLVLGALRIRIFPLQEESFVRFDPSSEDSILDQQELNSLLPLNFTSSDNLSFKCDDFLIHFDEDFLITITDKNGLKTTVNFDKAIVFESNRSPEKNPELFKPDNFRSYEDSFKNGPTSVALSFKFEGDDLRFSGLSSHTLPLNLPSTLKRDPIRFWNTDHHRYPINSTMSLYSSIPYLLVHSLSNSLGVLWLNSSETWVDLDSDFSRFISESGFIDFFFFSGNHKEVSHKYLSLAGKPQFVPLFVLGYHQSRWGYLTQDQVVSVSRRLDEIEVPHDVLWLDIDHTDNCKYFTFHPQNFADPLWLQSYMKERKRFLVVLIDPHVKIDDEYHVYHQAKQLDIFIKDKTGKDDFVGWCWPGNSVWLDFNNRTTKEFWIGLYAFKNFSSSTEIVFPWNDMNEISVFNSVETTAPKDLVHHGGYEEREVHNMYGHLMVEASYQALLKRKENQRPFILTRSYFIGSQKYACAWSGDDTASWEHLRNSLSLVLSNSLCGMVHFGLDVGGFFDDPSMLLLARWHQVGAWCYPFFRNHCHHVGKDREIYTMTEYQDLAKEAVKERYSMLPYWYLLSKNASVTGEPIVRPIWYEFHEKQFIDCETMLMLGTSLLVVPFLNEDTNSVEHELPFGAIWYDFRTFNHVLPQKKKIEYNEGRTAVFIRGGSVVPKKEKIRKSSGFMFLDPFTLVVALDNNQCASGEVYVDDGESFDFLSGGFVHKKIEFDGKYLKSTSIVESDSSFAENYNVLYEKIQIVGLKQKPISIKEKESDQTFDSVNNVTTITPLNLHVKANWILEFHF